MVRVIVAAHGQLASALVKATAMIVGSDPELIAVDFELDEQPQELYEKCRAAMGEASDVVFLVDMLGGSPYNAATHCCVALSSCDVVTGVNLPMVIDAASRAKQNANVAHIVRTAIQAGRSSVRALLTPLAPPDAPDELS
ncbi:PTS system, mannose-specific IIB component [Propionibacterium cyclohexanicum]|uniref:PTS system, mannose-specific IIB component n=1 Tax=Propionibacterium cyclohexanicum TaxID=64702 RepID=A0A1H9TER1_9ACTN|nr:PTS sugar transporter subunit IIA [Propionibacterium cyclohexanicum]SER95596.1 PTS system, mannose-specific IIB component [Propionibacterium cyclohexanicum]